MPLLLPNMARSRYIYHAQIMCFHFLTPLFPLEIEGSGSSDLDIPRVVVFVFVIVAVIG
jgi:hypothetical protein